MSTTKQQRIAKGMTRAARAIGLGATACLLLVLFLSLLWRAVWPSDILFLVYLVIALAGYPIHHGFGKRLVSVIPLG